MGIPTTALKPILAGQALLCQIQGTGSSGRIGGGQLCETAFRHSRGGTGSTCIQLKFVSMPLVYDRALFGECDIVHEADCWQYLQILQKINGKITT